MHKSMVAVGLALALSAGSAAIAAAQGVGSAPQRPQQHEQWDGRGGPRGMRGGAGGALLQGITLSDAQKAQLKQYREAQRSKFESERDQHRAEMQKARDARQRGDTAAANAMFRQFRAQMEQRRTAQIAAIRGILTPDQQRQFDANVAQWKQRAAQRDSAGARRGEHRGERHGQRQDAGSQG